MTRMSYLQAVSAALREEMHRDDRVFIMGEDVALILGSTPGFTEEFGTERIRNTPITEAGFVGAAAGAAILGMRPVVDMMFAPFLYCAFDQIVSVIAKSTYMYGGQCRMPVTLRATMFYRNGTSAQHSDRPMSTFLTIPGLKIIVPACPSDAKGLLKSAIRNDDPVIAFEDNTLWMNTEDVPEGDYLVPLGKGSVKRCGSDVTVVGISGAVVAAVEAAEALSKEGIDAEVIDPRTLAPLDMPMILASVEKTGHLVIADPCHETCSVASEITAIVAEKAFWHLRAPIFRVTTPQVHIPFSPPLEAPLYPSAERIAGAVRSAVSTSGVIRK